MSETVALKMEEYVPESDDEAKAILEHAIEQAVVEKSGEISVNDKATLEDMIAEATTFRSRGITFHAVPPVLRDLSAILKLFNTYVEAEAYGNESRMLEIGTEIGRRLFWVKDGDSLRTSREDEIMACFNLPKLSLKIMETLKSNGLEMDSKKNSSSLTGGIYSAESATDSEVMTSSD